jgi:hypothetical protein
MSAEEENERLALSVIEALNIRDLDPWSENLSDDYAAEYPGVPFLNKTQSIGYNRRFVIAFLDTLRGPQRRHPGRPSLHTLDGERYPSRAASDRHGENHPADPAKGDCVGRFAHRGEGRRDRA